MVVFITVRNGVPKGNVFIHVCPQGVWGPNVTKHGPVQTCSLGYLPTPFPLQIRGLPDLFEFVESVAHTTIGKEAVDLPL